jgi:hypothetical protein
MQPHHLHEVIDRTLALLDPYAEAVVDTDDEAFGLSTFTVRVSVEFGGRGEGRCIGSEKGGMNFEGEMRERD